MTLHYAVTRSQTMEEEFLKYKKVTRDGRTAAIDGTDLYELIQLDKRADRVLPNGWCTLPPKQLCDKGNACLTCPKFVTDATHAPELRRQLERHRAPGRNRDKKPSPPSMERPDGRRQHLARRAAATKSTH